MNIENNIKEQLEKSVVLKDDFGNTVYVGDKLSFEYDKEKREGVLAFAEDYLRFEVEILDEDGNVTDYGTFGTGELSDIRKITPRYTLSLSDIDNEIGVTEARVIAYATNRIQANSYDLEVVATVPYLQDYLSDISRIVGYDLSEGIEDIEQTQSFLCDLTTAVLYVLKNAPLELSNSIEVIRYFGEDVIAE